MPNSVSTVMDKPQLRISELEKQLEIMSKRCRVAEDSLRIVLLAIGKSSNVVAEAMVDLAATLGDEEVLRELLRDYENFRIKTPGVSN